MSGKDMKRKLPPDGMRPEYDIDYSKAVRGKYYERIMKEGSNIVKLEPDVAEVFRTDQQVNDALRGLLRARKTAGRSAPRAPRAKRS